MGVAFVYALTLNQFILRSALSISLDTYLDDRAGKNTQFSQFKFVPRELNQEINLGKLTPKKQTQDTRQGHHHLLRGTCSKC